MRFELRSLQYARALAEHGSFSRAAEALGVAQPTLSRGIKDLEDRVGVPLFHRKRLGNELTDFGRVFMQHAESLLKGARDLELEVDRVRGAVTAEVSAALGPYVVDAIGERAAGLFAVANPDVRLRLAMTDPASVVRAVRSRSVDLGLAEDTVIGSEDDIEAVMQLAPLQGWVFVRSGHPLVGRSDITLADLLDFPFAQVVMLPPRLLKPILAARRAPVRGPATPFPALECATVRLAIGAVAHSDAFTFGTLAQVRNDLVARRLVPLMAPPWLHSSWTIIRPRDRVVTPAILALIAAVQQAHAAVLRDNEELGAALHHRLAPSG